MVEMTEEIMELETHVDELFKYRCQQGSVATDRWTTKEANEWDLLKFICKGYYDNGTYLHCLRVTRYILMCPRFKYTSRLSDLIFSTHLALCHDLYEDTDCDRDFCNDAKVLTNHEALYRGIEMLTKGQDESYQDYCTRLERCDDIETPYTNDIMSQRMPLLAWNVKLADMKDHLSQTDTLTDKLKEKYLNGLAYLL